MTATTDIMTLEAQRSVDTNTNLPVPQQHSAATLPLGTRSGELGLKKLFVADHTVCGRIRSAGPTDGPDYVPSL
jgi:hypothetical protein